METDWKNQDIATKFEEYNDFLELTLGYNCVFKIIEQHGNLDTILDYGCGPGKVALRLAQKFNSTIIAVDQSSNMLRIAQEKRSHPRIRYARAISNSLNFIEKESVDLAVVCFVFINVKSLEEINSIICEIYRTLKKGGKIIILDTNPNSIGVSFSTFQNGVKGERYGCGSSRQEWLKLPDGSTLTLNDYHWPVESYLTSLSEKGFNSISYLEPTLRTLSESELNSVNPSLISETSGEWDHAPFIIFQGKK